MTHNEFKDYLFEVLNETEELDIADIETYDRENKFKVVVADGSQFIITTEPCGNMFILRQAISQFFVPNRFIVTSQSGGNLIHTN